MGTWPRALNLVDINGLDSKIWLIEVAGGGERGTGRGNGHRKEKYHFPGRGP